MPDQTEQNLRESSAHHAFVDALSAQYPALVSSVRLALRWVAAHMLLAGGGGGVRQEAVELLVAASFACPSRPTPGAASLTSLFHGSDCSRVNYGERPESSSVLKADR